MQAVTQTYAHVWLGDTSARDRPAQTPAAGPPRVSLGELFARYRLPPCIDLVDIDIQGSEYPRLPAQGLVGMFAAQGTLQLLSSRARAVHIGLHAGPELDKTLIQKFEASGWRVKLHFARSADAGNLPIRESRKRSHSVTHTPLGPVTFGDGVLSLVNQNPLPQCA
jgi:hypothetical protein